MRILHITTFLQGGAGRIITTLATAQRRAGHDVRVVADAGGEPGYVTYPEYTEALASEAIPLTLVRSTFKRDRVLNAEAAGVLQAWAHVWPPDIVHAHAAIPGLVARLAGLTARGAPIVHTMHGWGLAKTAGHAAADLALLRLADGVVTPSAAARRTLHQLGLVRPEIDVIPYGIDAASPPAPGEADLAALRRLDSAQRAAVCIGTIGIRKSQHLLVDALASASLRDVTAVFVGDGDAEPLVDRALARGVRDRVVVLGYHPRASRFLTIADALVLPSRNEGLPIAVLEAFRAGVPVVATDIPEIAEIVEDHRLGFLFDSGDVDGLASALDAALRLKYPHDFGARLRERFHACYTADRMAHAYGALYARLIDTPSASRLQPELRRSVEQHDAVA
jgi:L-malate glycosyltransferase